MKKRFLFLFAALSVFTLFSCKESIDNNLDLNNQIDLTDQEATNREYTPPWVFVMDTRFSRETCHTGPGVCFKNYDGEILIIGTDASIGDIFIISSSNNGDLDIGAVAYKMEDNQLRLAFSRSLEEDFLIIDEDEILHEKLAIALGKQSIILPKGRYPLNFDNFEHGEAIIPINFADIQLDHHSDYGVVEKMDYQVGKEVGAEDFLQDLGLSETDVQDYSISQFDFSGIANAEHLVDGKIIHVWHEYQDQPSVMFEAELTDGSHIASTRILACGNPSAEEYHKYLLEKYAWFFFGYL